MIREPETILLRNGPLENLWGRGGGAKYKKKNPRKENQMKKKFMQTN